ncbi:MAG: adenylyltransferase/cytidyltransferase family protein [Lachnospiraceae bacterium]|nr:adenylyltransferase/cytidyltransferase family protein [Lachnospiraceae bacterium]
MKKEELIRDFRKGSLQWYPFPKGAEVLFIGKKEDALFEMLQNKHLSVEIREASYFSKEVNLEKQYDYIVAIESLEVLPNYESVVEKLLDCLTTTGHFLLGVNNRLGIRYFSGDKDPYTNQVMDGVDNYRRAYSKKEDAFFGKCYDKATVLKLISNKEKAVQCYSVYPDFSNAQILLRDDYESPEDLAIRILPAYHSSKTVFLEEEFLYNSLRENHLFHEMANCILFDVMNQNASKQTILQVTSSMGRDERDSFLTVIYEDDLVKKIPAYEEGREKLKDMERISAELKDAGIHVVDGKVEENTYCMPFIKAKTCQVYFEEILNQNVDLFLEKMDEFVQLIIDSSEHMKEDSFDGEGVVLKRGYPDMMPLNSFYIDGEIVFFDQEFSIENYPANAIIIRAVYCMGTAIARNGKLKVEDLIKRYHLDTCLDKWNQMQAEFIVQLRNEKELHSYFDHVRRNPNMTHSNRQRMNYSTDEYQRIFVNIFENLEYKKVILFGTGRFAERFLELYGTDYSIAAVIDNNSSRHGEDFHGVKISGPEILEEYELGTYRVIVCIKNYLSVIQQLENLGIKDFGIFDPNQEYQRPRHNLEIQNDVNQDAKPKKYYTGYISGVFDLFHVGHLEKFKLAKEQCDYLIVGLVTDEGVKKYKKTTPFVPYEERKAMLEACRYVDEVVRIPLDINGPRDAWKMFHFDVQFSGSDYVDDPYWLEEKDWLNDHGVDIVFFPYTESTSSSKLKALIDEKLI